MGKNELAWIAAGLLALVSACAQRDTLVEPTCASSSASASESCARTRSEDPAAQSDSSDAGSSTDSSQAEDLRPDSADSADDVAQGPEVAFLEPANGASVANPVHFRLLARGVRRVALDADGHSLGEYDPALADGLDYTFHQVGIPRQIRALGYDESGVQRASATLTITVSKAAEPSPPVPSEGKVRLEVPYFYQYDNSKEPGSTCGLTSAAMLLNYWFPNSTTPDKLYGAYGKGQGQSPTGLAELYRLRGLNADSTYAGSRANVRAQLDAGRPVVVHGNLTASGHILVIIGYDATGFYINDPAGDWYQCYGCDTSGKGLHIDYGSEFDRKLGADGDMWLSAASKVAFDPFP